MDASSWQAAALCNGKRTLSRLHVVWPARLRRPCQDLGLEFARQAREGGRRRVGREGGPHLQAGPGEEGDALLQRGAEALARRGLAQTPRAKCLRASQLKRRICTHGGGIQTQSTNRENLISCANQHLRLLLRPSGRGHAMRRRAEMEDDAESWCALCSICKITITLSHGCASVSCRYALVCNCVHGWLDPSSQYSESIAITQPVIDMPSFVTIARSQDELIDTTNRAVTREETKRFLPQAWKDACVLGNTIILYAHTGKYVLIDAETMCHQDASDTSVWCPFRTAWSCLSTLPAPANHPTAFGFHPSTPT